MPITKRIPWMLPAGLLVAAMVLGADGTTPGIAQPPPAAAPPAKEEPKPEPLVLRVYDVKDLLLISLDHRFPGGMMVPADVYETKSYYDQGDSTFGGIFAGHAARDANAMKARLVDLLQATVPWNEMGHDGSPVYQFAGSFLFIKQTPANHKVIEGILAEIRKTAGRRRMVTIQAWWLALDDKQLAQLVPDAGARRAVPLEVNPDAFKGAEALYRGETTCTEGQAVHIASGRGQTILANFTPVVSENAVACQPTVNMVFWGAMLEATVALASEGDSASIDFRSVVSEPKEVGTIPIVNMSPSPTTAPAVFPKGLDRLDFAVWLQGATLRLPLGKPVIAGGMNGPEMKGKHLYLILQVIAAKN